MTRAHALGETQLELKDMVTLTGRSASPGLFEVLDLLGRSVALARLARAADMTDAA